MRYGDGSRGGVGGQGNGGKRLNKYEKERMVAALANSGKFNGRGRCGYKYGCVWEGELINGLCAEHWRGEKLRAAGVKRWQEGRARTSLPSSYGADHTAPWHCRVQGCEKCDGKPTYEGWVAAR